MPRVPAPPSLPYWLAAIWLVLVSGGFLWIMNADVAPGAMGAVPDRWPAGTPLGPMAGRPALVVALHPHCPCSAATLETVAAMLPHAAPDVRIILLFLADPARPAEWVESALWSRAGTLPVERRRDPDGHLAAAFGAETSGMVVAYDVAGEAGYRGGITPARGQQARGDPATLAAVVFGTASETPDALPVFGCPLRSAGRAS